MKTIQRLLLLVVVLVLAACSSSDEQAQISPLSPQASIRQVSEEDLEIVKGQTVYVPTYSNIFYTDSEQTWDLAVTVSIRSTDPINPIIITSARFYDTDGNLVTDYVEESVELAPLGTASLVLERTDARGGVGANFIIEWAAETEVLEPVIESVMISTAGTQGLGFISPGRVISDDDLDLVTGQSVYVPAYSDIFFAHTKRTWDLTVTLAIHNTDPNHPITITSVRYYDTEGNLVIGYVDEPIELNPWATSGVLIERTDKSGGVGANFIVEWEANMAVSEPVIEAVMVSTSGTQGLGFSSPGRVISQTP